MPLVVIFNTAVCGLSLTALLMAIFSWKNAGFRGRGGRQVLPHIVLPDKFRFYLRRPLLENLLEKLRLQRRFRTGDPAFDDRVCVQTDDPVFLNALVQRSGLRSAILQALEVLQTPTIRCWRGKLSTEMYFSNSEPEESIRRSWEAAVQALRPVADHLMAIPAPEWHNSRDPTATRVHLFGVFVGALGMIVGAITAIWAISAHVNGLPHDPFHVTQTSSCLLALALCIVTLLPVLWAARWLVRGGSRFNIMLAYVLFIVEPATWSLSQAWFRHANVHSDDSVRQEYVVRVVDQYFTRSRGRYASTRCHLVMDRWPDARMPSSLKVPHDYCVKPNTCFQIVYRQGHFGDPWLESMRVARSCNRSSPLPGTPSLPEMSQ